MRLPCTKYKQEAPRKEKKKKKKNTNQQNNKKKPKKKNKKHQKKKKKKKHTTQANQTIYDSLTTHAYVTFKPARKLNLYL